MCRNVRSYKILLFSATVCGICHEYDPPRQDENSLKPYTTEWVGCDCDRWFHKTCTKLQRFTTLFSCRSVKMKCIGVHVPLKSKRPKKKVQDQPEEEEINLTVVHHWWNWKTTKREKSIFAKQLCFESSLVSVETVKLTNRFDQRNAE